MTEVPINLGTWMVGGTGEEVTMVTSLDGHGSSPFVVLFTRDALGNIFTACSRDSKVLALFNRFRPWDSGDFFILPGGEG